MEILPRMVRGKATTIQLLISPILSVSDKDAIIRAVSEEERTKLRQMTTEHMIEEVFRFGADPGDLPRRLELFAWLVANECLLLRFAFPSHLDDVGMYHEKIGILDFPWGDRVAFMGSGNESVSGHVKNYEVMHVYRSWVKEDRERVEETCQDFDQAWEGRAVGLDTVPLSEKALQYIKERAPAKDPTLDEQAVEKGTPPTDAASRRWRHQDEAVAIVLEKKHGVLEMATGTGKTRTALKILSSLLETQEIRGAIVATEGVDLLEQWYKGLLVWVQGNAKKWRVLRHYGSFHQLQTFALDPMESVLVISRSQLSSLFHLLGDGVRRWLAIVHDEVHGLGSPQNRAELANAHQAFVYRLGLSATPEREYDIEGTQFITQEIGPVIYSFDLKDAIERGILCEFDYVPLPYHLTDNDKRRLQQVFAKQAARAAAGTPMAETEVWIELARVYKTAEEKPSVFAQYVEAHPEIVKSTIIFVETKEFGEQLLPLIQRYTHVYRTYYAEDDRNNLFEFSRGNMDCLITCHRISQGIDIRQLKNVVLFSAARAKLETIQRIGRCLRTDPINPAKRAVIVDFVRAVEPDDQFPSADTERSTWLTTLAQVKRKE